MIVFTSSNHWRALGQELTKYVEQFQADADADFHHEYFIHDAVDAFETSERTLDASLDAWVAATPDSFAPYVARGAHRFAFDGQPGLKIRHLFRRA